MADNTTTTPPFHSTTSEEEIVNTAKERAVENMLTVDQALGKSTEDTLKKT